MSTLVLHLPLAPPGPHGALGYTLSADGLAVTGHGHAVSAAQLPAPGRAGEIVALVPLRALSWQRVHLPAAVPLGQAQRLRAVLQGLLEDQLLDAPETLHFALAPNARAGEALWVAVCDRAWLRDWLQVLDAAGRPVSRIVPEFAPLPSDGPGSQDSAAYALGPPEEGLWVLQMPGHSPLCLPLEGGSATLQATFEASASTQTPAAGQGAAARSVTLWADPSVAALVQPHSAQPIQLQGVAERALLAARSPWGPWDLAQLEFSRSGRARALRGLGAGLDAFLHAPQWRAARWALGSLLAVQVLGLNAWAWQDRQSLAAKQAQVRAALTRSFPQVRVVIDAPLQMQREIERLRQDSAQLAPQDAEPLLAAAGQALQALTPAQTPTAMDYRPGQLRLRGLTIDAPGLTALSEALRPAGYSAQTEGAGVDQVLLISVQNSVQEAP